MLSSPLSSTASTTDSHQSIRPVVIPTPRHRSGGCVWIPRRQVVCQPEVVPD